ncbi:zinc finger protein CG2199 isoform X1 [Drosophila albomicans]|uniref:Zinc finger protein CG2199 isoform X1 n=1 Tax=Drosophila albomicans TaxID=7291 RepID=A0A6P8XG59_DROAB|nr:zinc finger protein CG2199 isoform X1 [Drosophila albomicans]
MSGNVKKAVAVCDYCKTEKDSSQIYSGRKHFAGFKIVDILKIITKLEIPTNTPIKLCTMCISTLHATSGVIERAGEMINHLVPLPKNQAGVANKTNIEINDKPIQVPSDSEPEEPDEPTRQEIFNSPSKNMAATNGTSTVFKKQLDKSPKKQLFSTGGPSKLNESLKHVIKLTPADGAANKSTAFSQLFGNSVNHISDSDGSSDEEEEATKGPEEKRNIATNFECKLCDFTSVYPNPMKIHMKDIHDQKRPRIYDCTKCHKCFGLLKTLKVHLLTHGMVEEKEKENKKEKEKGAPDVTLARLTALNPKPKDLKNGELTFAVQNTNSSTPKPGEPLKVKPVSINSFKCDICHEDIKGIKAFQKHMTIVHNIEKPKIFKCPECESEFMHKSTMGKHIKMKHGEGAELNVPRRRKTIDERALLGNMEGGEKIKKPAKIAARRKTVDVSIALAGMSQAKNKKLPQVLEEMNSDNVVTPKKPKKSTQQLITESLKSSPKIAKLSDNNNKENAANLQNGTAIEEAATTSKKNVSKKDIDVIDTSQITPLNTESPKKKAKKDSEVLASPALSVGTPKKTKPKKDKDGFATPQNTPIATPNKVKRKKDALDTSQLLINNGNESTSETPKKSNKRKHKLSESSPKLVIDEDYEEETSKQSPLKKSKQDEFIGDDDIILFEEVNSNPLPHRREMLESMSQDSIDTSSALSCSQCNKVVSTRKRLDSHIRKKHSGHLKCRECSQSFTQSNDFVGHFANCVAFERLACGVQNCDKVFAAANFLSAHLKKKHKFN